MIENNIIQSLGAGSGIDSRSLVKQLTEIERTAPQERIDTKRELRETQISDFGLVKSALATFQTAAQALIKPEGLFSKSATYTQSDSLVPTTISTTVEPGTYKFEVNELAQSQTLASSEFVNQSDAVGLGTLTFNFGEWDVGTFTADSAKTSKTITIDASNNSLKGLKDTINNAKMGVTASIINNGSGFVLSINAETGFKNQIEIIAAEGGAPSGDIDDSGLSRFAFNAASIAEPGTAKTTQKQEGKDAELVVNGLTISRSTNTVSDVVDGLTLDLLKKSPGEIISVTVSNDKTFAKQTTRDFVDAYNTLLETLEPAIGYDKENEKRGSLANDALAKSVISQMRNIFASTVTGLPDSATFTALTNLGVRTELDGTLSIKDKEFDKAFDENFEAIQKLLAPATQSSASGISVNSFGKQTQAGEYDVVITQTPRRGAFTAGVIATGFPLDTTGKNYGLNLSVNGVATDLIEMPVDVTYNTEADLAAAMQTAINNDAKLKAANSTVSVTFSAGAFVITSGKFGDSSSVNVVSATGDAFSDLGIAAGNGTNGRDVGGTINGVAGFGLGQVLLPKLGEAAEGLSLIVGDNATGGKVNFSRGVTGQLDTLINTFLQTNGLIKKREDTLKADVTNLKDDEKQLDRRMTAYEERLMQQFIAMENIVNGLNGSGDFLDNLFKSLPFTSSRD